MLSEDVASFWLLLKQFVNLKLGPYKIGLFHGVDDLPPPPLLEECDQQVAIVAATNEYSKFRSTLIRPLQLDLTAGLVVKLDERQELFVVIQLLLCNICSRVPFLPLPWNLHRRFHKVLFPLPFSLLIAVEPFSVPFFGFALHKPSKLGSLNLYAVHRAFILHPLYLQPKVFGVSVVGALPVAVGLGPLLPVLHQLSFVASLDIRHGRS